MNHALSKFSWYIRLYRSVTNFNCRLGEHKLQSMVKHSLANTKWLTINFTSSVPNCNYDKNKIKSKVEKFWRSLKTDEDTKISGLYTANYWWLTNLNKPEKGIIWWNGMINLYTKSAIVLAVISNYLITFRYNAVFSIKITQNTNETLKMDMWIIM